MTGKLLKAKNLDAFLEEYTSKLEQKFVSQSKQLQTITNNASSCLFLIDMKGRPTYMNPAAIKVTGYRLSEIKNQVLTDILHRSHQENSPDSHDYIIQALKEKKQIKDQEEVFARKDGTLFPVSFSVAPLTDGGKLQGAVLEFQDITKRKELERQKDEFIGVASHELKTPVTSIKAYAQVLQSRFEEARDMRSADLVGKMDGQLDKLTNLIADLLDVTKIQGGRLLFHETYFGFNKLAKEISEEIQRTTNRHNIQLKLGPERTVFADRDRTGQVLTNFLTNAIKYSPHSKRIALTTSVENGNIQLCVKDYGVGISKSKQKKVFERFYRISGPKEDTYPGLGLGLYISSEIVRRQGGRIWVKSEAKKGSTFCFSLPLPERKRRKKRK